MEARSSECKQSERVLNIILYMYANEITSRVHAAAAHGPTGMA